MTECSACGAALKNFETRCPFCGKPTIHYHRQRRCLHCGAPAAQKATTCMMCGRPVDSLPLAASFSGSWLGVTLGVAVIVGLVWGVNTYQPLYHEVVQAAQATPTPTATATPALFRPPTATATPPPTTSPTIIPSPTPRTHVVEAGQALYYIAQLYQVSVEELAAMNNLADSRMLRVGQVLVVPDSPINWDTADNQLPPQIIHVIQAGETLGDLSVKYDTPLDTIFAANPEVNPDLVYEGQEIIIPLAMPTATPTPTPMPTATPTATPRYLPPNLLAPADGQFVNSSTLFFNWTATGWLTADEFYVLQLAWPDGSYTAHWTKGNSWRFGQKDRPSAGVVTWSVAIMRQTGADATGSPVGVELATPDQLRTVEWW